MSIALVIDDNPTIRSFVAEVLFRAGYQVVEAKNGHEGVRLSQELTPEIVISDIYMPGQDGIYVLRELRRLKQPARIVMMSGGSKLIPDFNGLECARKLGADATLQKPFTPYELMQAVTNLPVLN